MGICHLLWFPPLIRKKKIRISFFQSCSDMSETPTPAPLSTLVTHQGAGGVCFGREQQKDNQQLPAELGMASGGFLV